MKRVNLSCRGHQMVVIDVANGDVLTSFSLRTHNYKDALKWCDEQKCIVVNRSSFVKEPKMSRKVANAMKLSAHELINEIKFIERESTKRQGDVSFRKYQRQMVCAAALIRKCGEVPDVNELFATFLEQDYDRSIDPFNGEAP